ncbi:HdeD family acid-resistance protein [Streptomyces sp. NPDC058330]|uniref:HdeD family acid-resistance protein n=1 Tax=Streptomyces sp. NPDC058330 TaxID=3346449 RepID=UPI0036EE85D6
MTGPTTEPGPTPEGRKLRRGFGGLALLGALLVVAGLVDLVHTGVATLTSMLLFGWLLLIGGLVGLLHAVQARGTPYFWLGVVVAALNIAAGVVVIHNPVGTAEALTMFAALLFLTGGVFRLVGSVVVRGPQFGWTLLQGAFGLLLGLLATGIGGRRIVSLMTDQRSPQQDKK